MNIIKAGWTFLKNLFKRTPARRGIRWNCWRARTRYADIKPGSATRPIYERSKMGRFWQKLTGIFEPLPKYDQNRKTKRAHIPGWMK